MTESPSRVERALYQTSEIGRLVSEVALGGLVSLTVVDIILRYVFNNPLAYTVELVGLALAIVVFFGIVVCTAQRGHVNINVLLTRFPRRVQAAINSFFYFLSAGIFGVIAWRSVVYAMQTQDMNLVSTMLKLPYYPFILVIALCSLLTGLLFLSQFIHFVVETVRK